MGGELLASFGIKNCDLKVRKLILFKEQSHPVRVIVASVRKQHKTPEGELRVFFLIL